MGDNMELQNDPDNDDSLVTPSSRPPRLYVDATGRLKTRQPDEPTLEPHRNVTDQSPNDATQNLFPTQ